MADLSKAIENRNLKSKDLWKYWLEANQEKQPFGTPIKSKPDYPATFLEPKKVSAVLKAFSPFDLYSKPDYTPTVQEYPSPGYNIHNLPLDVGIPEANIYSTKTSPKYGLKGMQDMVNDFTDIPKELHKNIPQAIYEHELAHKQDPRILPEARNYGYMKRWGLPGTSAGREKPAIKAEDLFWDALMKRRQQQ